MTPCKPWNSNVANILKFLGSFKRLGVVILLRGYEAINILKYRKRVRNKMLKNQIMAFGYTQLISFTLNFITLST